MTTSDPRPLVADVFPLGDHLAALKIIDPDGTAGYWLCVPGPHRPKVTIPAHEQLGPLPLPSVNVSAPSAADTPEQTGDPAAHTSPPPARRAPGTASRRTRHDRPVDTPPPR